mmetsp:Transcript_4507/g.5073  ORF Transcript_4507/g.5073 Transcript_4507/m.5073 type:complete len:137 (+) Transcript_4507:68-478(+)
MSKTRVTCSNGDCAKPYHKDCAASCFYHKQYNEVDFTAYTCMECNATNIPVPNQWDTLANNDINDVNEKLGRFGIPNIDGEAISTMNQTIKKLESTLKKVSIQDDYNAILNSNPNPYPTPVHMNPDSIKKTHNAWT